MGTNVNFYGSPSKDLYAPARNEVDYDDEMLTNMQNLGEHDHGDGGGKQLAFGSPVAIGTANADGAGTTPARHNHVHAHGSIAGAASAIHPDLADSVHGHGSQYADSSHSHSVSSEALWEHITDATNGDAVRTVVQTPATHGTTVRARQTATGAFEIIQGSIGDGASTEGVGGPFLNLVQRNADPDGASPDHLLLGGISATHSNSNYLGDNGRTFSSYTFARGEQAIFFRAYYATATRASLTPSESWEEIIDADVAKARMEFAIRPSWSTHANSPWPWGMKMSEDGDVTIRGRFEAGGGMTVGTNDSAYGSGTYHNGNTTEVGLPGATTGGRRSTRITVWGTPSYNDNTFASILMLPYGVDKDPAVSSLSWIEYSLDFSASYKMAIENGAAAYTGTWEETGGNFNPGFSFFGTSASGPEFLAGLSTFRDNAGAKRSPGVGLFYSHGAKHADARIIGDNALSPSLYIARGSDYGGGNQRGEMIWANHDNGFGYEAAGGWLRIRQWNDLSTATMHGGALPGPWTQSNNYGITIDGKANGSGGLNSNLLTWDAATNRVAFGAIVGTDSHLLVNGNSYLKISGRWYQIIIQPGQSTNAPGQTVACYLSDTGTTPPA